MAGVISIHEYALKPEVDPADFERAIRNARERGLLQVDGLQEYYFLRGMKGDRRGQYTAVWLYESAEAWEAIWGPPDDPVPKAEYPERWKTWEDEVLAPFLADDPDEILFTSYEVL